MCLDWHLCTRDCKFGTILIAFKIYIHIKIHGEIFKFSLRIDTGTHQL